MPIAWSLALAAATNSSSLDGNIVTLWLQLVPYHTASNISTFPKPDQCRHSYCSKTHCKARSIYGGVALLFSFMPCSCPLHSAAAAGGACCAARMMTAQQPLDRHEHTPAPRSYPASPGKVHTAAATAAAAAGNDGCSNDDVGVQLFNTLLQWQPRSPKATCSALLMPASPCCHSLLMAQGGPYNR